MGSPEAALDSAVADASAGGAADAGPSADADSAVNAEAGTMTCPTDGGIPDDLGCTGLYSDWPTRTVATDAIPFTPGLVFWSDGVMKSRWIQLPAGSQIDTTDMDNWVFPVGTKIWKAFVLGGQLVETRLIWKQSNGWSFLDYRWSADGSSATRLDTGETNVNGTTYEIPSTAVCYRCHGGRGDNVLGLDLVGLGIGAAQGVTLASLSAQGRFTQPPPATAVMIPEDSTAKAAAALGWLHVNCGSSCHNTNGAARASQLYMKLLAGELYPADGGAARVSQLDTYTSAVNVRAFAMPNGVQYMRIVPGNSAMSLIPLMDSTRGDDAGFTPMPPLVSHIPDTAGVALVTAWIDALGDAGL